jgi:hypothetical protein
LALRHRRYCCSLRASTVWLGWSGVVGLFPGAGALEGDPVSAQELPEPLAADRDLADGVAVQVVGELAQAPVGERELQPGRARGGRLDDEVLIVAGDAPTPTP